MKLHFKFFKDVDGRLRATCLEFGVTKPVERADHSKRYKFAKVFGLYKFNIAEQDYLRLQTAKDGDIVEVKTEYIWR